MSPFTKTRLLSLAVIAVAALVVAAPAAATITSSPSGNTASFVNTGNKTITIGSNVVTCSTFTMTGTVSGSSYSAAAPGTTWSNCTYTFAGISGAATVTDTAAWTLTITAALGGGSFSVSQSLGFSIQAGPCTITFTFATSSGTTWTNTTKSLVSKISSLKFGSSGFLCPLPASGSNGAMAFSESEPTLTVS